MDTQHSAPLKPKRGPKPFFDSFKLAALDAWLKEDLRRTQSDAARHFRCGLRTVSKALGRIRCTDAS